MNDKFDLLAEDLVLAGKELNEGVEFENPMIHNINLAKKELNYILYECAKSRKEIKDILDDCIGETEKHLGMLSEDDRKLLESYFLEVSITRKKIDAELSSLRIRLNRIDNHLWPWGRPTRR